MVRIRLARLGSIKRPFYRVIASDSRAPRNGKFLEILGTYSPLANPPEIKLDEGRIKVHVDNGALLSDTVKSLLKQNKAAVAGKGA